MGSIGKTMELSKTNTELSTINEQFANNLPTMTPDKLAKISERMVEMDRANKTLGRSQTQTTNQLMTLTMLTDSPYRRLRQCLTQIQKKRNAIEAQYFKNLKTELRIKQWKEKGDELSNIKIAEAELGKQQSLIYIEGAFKEIAVFQEAYEEIRRNNNIPEEWDERDAEMDEIRHHIRQAFRQAHRDTLHQGSISQGNAEYLEQYGIHIHTAQNVINKYIAECQRVIDEDGQMPNISHLYEFLDSCVEVFGKEYEHVMKHIGINTLVRNEYLYRSTK